MHTSTPPLAGLCAAALLALAGCDRPADEAPAGDPAEDPVAGAPAESAGDVPADGATDAVDVAATTDAASGEPFGADVDEDELPYPVYPNGERYRVGGENGLKIVLYETTDSFEEVDAYYGERAAEAGMPRLAAMDDYVRYSREDGDDDPWGTDRPGIVIHRFEDDSAREAVGADAEARTNIIMSY